MVFTETVTLANGVVMPMLGFGTWMIDDDAVVQPVKDAIELGYRHIDTAAAYHNEVGVGKAVKASGVPREELFITTKLAAEKKDYESAKVAIDKALVRLDMDYIDLMIIHSPQPWADFRGDDHYFEGNLEAWRALEEALEAGKLRAIGVSNFEEVDLDNLLKNAKVKPMVNQILAHISNVPNELVAFSQENNIVVEAYSPIAHGAILHHPTVQETAAKYDVSPAQLSIRYVIQLGMVALPKSTNKDHIKDNAELDFTISDADMETLNQIPMIEDYGEDRDMPVFSSQF
ncbi:aldo/keto reductase [Fundicoccus culcitae]|uniref:Aldo/keto reductase n=1 Tax=Fundicoccus culcitae TaxID=2969821 RepID=A0ABY5P217_9LACT|nr:aldo/keto reductase [Fundicoccus culcitae]UUX32751.1 aldo/keto reductase [Fundicoccus culcitae]